jgi:hypothetical protein
MGFGLVIGGSEHRWMKSLTDKLGKTLDTSVVFHLLTGLQDVSVRNREGRHEQPFVLMTLHLNRNLRLERHHDLKRDI